MGDARWFRVVDPLNPFFGCDVSGVEGSNDGGSVLLVTALRKVDIFVGDRPFQLIAAEGQHLGVSIQAVGYGWDGVLEQSPLQDATIEIGTDLPYGECVEEENARRRDGASLHIVTYQRAFQVALLDQTGRLAQTKIIPHSSERDVGGIRNLFESESPVDDIIDFMTRV